MENLHLHSEYSVLDGLGSIMDIAIKNKQNGSKCLCVTDHASISALPSIFKYAKEFDLKPIIGVEFYFVLDYTFGDLKDQKRYHITVFAKNWNGVKSIMHQLTLANQQFYRRPILDYNQLYDFEDCIISSACCFGLLSTIDAEDRVRSLSKKYKDDFYLEIMPHKVIIDNIDLQKLSNDIAIDLHRKYNIKLLATNDSHYINKEDGITQSLLLAIQYKKEFKGELTWDGDFSNKNEEETYKQFLDLGYIDKNYIQDAIDNTTELSNKINIIKPDFKVNLPCIHDDERRVFRTLILEGWDRVKYSIPEDKHSIYIERIAYELKTIVSMKFDRYFLIVHDAISFAKSKGIMVGGRGSSAGSIICWLLGITYVDPIKFDLFFERFLNPDRIEMPDIDVDFEDTRRQEVFDYVSNKYGADKTARVNTFGVLSIKSAFRDVSRAFGIPNFEINRLSKLIEDEDSFSKDSELSSFYNKSEKNKEIINQAKKLTGAIRQVGVHACALVVSSEPLENICAIEKRKKNFVSCWDKKDVESFGLLKMDFLGLSTLSIINMALKLVKERHSIDIDINKINLDDKKTFELLSKGETVGVFQFENSGMQELLRSLNVSDFATAYATTALYRPGSLDSGETSRYVKIKNNKIRETYACEELRSVLSETKGVLVYQEQIMKIFNVLGGFTMSEADTMRKIIAKKGTKEEFNKHRQHFTDGCKKNNISEDISTSLFDNMQEFSKYSFNKSHAVSYTLNSYVSCYLKANYPIEFFTAALSFCKKESIQELALDAKRMNIEISTPDINLSELKYSIHDGVIIPPFDVVDGIGDKANAELIKARNGVNFIDYDDFLNRINKRVVNKKVIDVLYKTGAFKDFGMFLQVDEERFKNYSLLLPTYIDLPKIELNKEKYNYDDLVLIQEDYTQCAANNKKRLFNPETTSKNPAIMIINKHVKNETVHIGRSGKTFLSDLKKIGIRKRDIYYTSLLKCLNKNKPSNKCLSECSKFLKEEIKVIQPKLIICFDTEAMKIFDKKNMNVMHNKVVYNSEFNAYIIFSYSPQYAYYQYEKIGDKFNKIFTTLKYIFNK